MPALDVLEAIRAIFLHPLPYVTTRHAAALLGWKMPQLQIAIAKGEVDTEETCRGTRIPLSEVAAIARERWQPLMIEQALGNAAKDILPNALRTRAVSLRLSKYIIATLHYLALKEGVSVDVIAARQLDRLAIEHSEELAAVIGDFRAALEWPEPHDVEAVA